MVFTLIVVLAALGAWGLVRTAIRKAPLQAVLPAK